MKTEFIIKLTKFEMIIFTIASAIILEYSLAAYIAMTHDGTVINRFNDYHEGWFEVVLMLFVGWYLLIVLFGSKKHET